MSEKSPIPFPNQPRLEASATHRAYETLRRMIVVGELQPGEKLKIDNLRAKLDTGASPIREALSLLTSDYLVERIDHKGFRAAPASLENFEEILTLRCSLEEIALRKCLAKATPEWEEELVLCHHRLSREPERNSEAFELHHKSFHMALLANCDSPILLRFCNQLYDLNIRYRYVAGSSINYQQRDVDSEHERIMRAAIDRNAIAASEYLSEHYRKTGAFLTDLISSKESG